MFPIGPSDEKMHRNTPRQFPENNVLCMPTVRCSSIIGRLHSHL